MEHQEYLCAGGPFNWKGRELEDYAATIRAIEVLKDIRDLTYQELMEEGNE